MTCILIFFLDPDASLLFRCVGKGGGTADAYRVCVPTQAIRREVLKEMHDAPASGHFGVDRTYIRLAQHFFWRSMQSDVEAYVSSCSTCQANKAYTAQRHGIPTPLEVPDGRWQAVALDLVSLDTSEEGYDAAVVFTDTFTKQIYCAPKGFGHPTTSGRRRRTCRRNWSKSMMSYADRQHRRDLMYLLLLQSPGRPGTRLQRQPSPGSSPCCSAKGETRVRPDGRRHQLSRGGVSGRRPSGCETADGGEQDSRRPG